MCQSDLSQTVACWWHLLAVPRAQILLPAVPMRIRVGRLRGANATEDGCQPALGPSSPRDCVDRAAWAATQVDESPARGSAPAMIERDRDERSAIVTVHICLPPSARVLS